MMIMMMMMMMMMMIMMMMMLTTMMMMMIKNYNAVNNAKKVEKPATGHLSMSQDIDRRFCSCVLCAYDN